jgi:hypothetical protein
MHGSCETLDSSTSKTEKMKKLQKSIIPSNQHLREPAKLEVDPGFEVTRTRKIRETAIYRFLDLKNVG